MGDFKDYVQKNGESFEVKKLYKIAVSQAFNPKTETMYYTILGLDSDGYVWRHSAKENGWVQILGPTVSERTEK